ncbi:MAG: VWA domain-containing protein [Deltaproteobacteria bacterium]|nr:MAG: VWA domain-containing protein [Deltaproteobacteria bacterium]
MTRSLCSLLAFLLAATAAPLAFAQSRALRVEIQTPTSGFLRADGDTSIEVAGAASTFGDASALDVFLVLDTSKSLRRIDPTDRRAERAAELVQNLPAGSGVRIGVVDFDWDGELRVPLTENRAAVLEALRRLDQFGSTDLAAGVRAALDGFERSARSDAARRMVLITDGRSDAGAAGDAFREARRRGVAIDALLLGSDPEAEAMLREATSGTGGTFAFTTDPAALPRGFSDILSMGVDDVTLRVNDSPPIPAVLAAGRFSAHVPLRMGENEIVAIARSVTGETREDRITLTVGARGCSELRLSALRDGRRTHSIFDRAVELVFDASNSMWGRVDERPKMAVAKQVLEDALDSLPPDVTLALRVYGRQHPREQRDCRDTELLVPLASGSRSQIREAIASVRPRGQSPLARSLRQTAGDLGSFRGERAVVLVTDGIESCGGDPVAAAAALQETGRIPIHVIGFGLGSEGDEDRASLRAIAAASGGRFLTVRSGEELRDALGSSMGTRFRVLQGDTMVADGTLGVDEVMRLPEGDYVVKLDSTPRYSIPVTLESGAALTLTIERSSEGARLRRSRGPAADEACALASGASIARRVPAVRARSDTSVATR